MRTDIINKYYSKTLRYLIAMLFILPAFTTTSGYELPNDRETLYLQKVAPSSLISAVEASQSDSTHERVMTPGGFMARDTLMAYVADYQGNVRAVVDKTGAVREQNNYYPYGLLMPTPAVAAAPVPNDFQPYKYSAKELDRQHALDLLNFGARLYDPARVAFTTVDPLAEKTPGLSPYTFCAANPIRFIDNDGRKVIFVNGFQPHDVDGEEYWNEDNETFVPGAMEYFHDYNVMYLSINHHALSTASERFINGVIYAYNNIKSIVENLSPNESIKLVSHSMGAAFAEGMAYYLVSEGYNISDIVHLNPFQAADIRTTDYKSNKSKLKTIDYQNTNDKVIKNKFRISPGDIRGADKKIREKSQFTYFKKVHSSPLYEGSKFWQRLGNILIKH